MRGIRHRFYDGIRTSSNAYAHGLIGLSFNSRQTGAHDRSLHLIATPPQGSLDRRLTSCRIHACGQKTLPSWGGVCMLHREESATSGPSTTPATRARGVRAISRSTRRAARRRSCRRARVYGIFGRMQRAAEACSLAVGLSNRLQLVLVGCGDLRGSAPACPGVFCLPSLHLSPHADGVTPPPHCSFLSLYLSGPCFDHLLACPRQHDST